jgi:lysophospholipase L1-like esterase
MPTIKLHKISFSWLVALILTGMSFLPSVQIFANDSDVVNCGRSWRIVVLGSSTAYGTGASTTDSSWVNRYRRYVKSKNVNSQVFNLGIPGYRTYQNLRPDGYVPPINRPAPASGFNITAALALTPDAIIINMPSNDAASNYTVAEQKANFEETFRIADSANIPIWVTTTQPRFFMTADQMQNLRDMRQWIIDRFGSKSINFWDGIANPDGTVASFYYFDNVHVNNRGHEEFFNRMKQECLLDSLCRRYLGTTTIKSKIFLEGFLTSNNQMRTKLFDLGISSDSSAVDSVVINLWKPSNVNYSQPDYTQIGILKKNGLVSVDFPGDVSGRHFYISVKHQNSMEIWSSDSVQITNLTFVDFTENINKTFSNGSNLPQKLMQNSVFGIYSGDVNQDGSIDLFDIQKVENDATSFTFGNQTSDCNGDGAVDLVDMQIVENNSGLFIFLSKPQ